MKKTHIAVDSNLFKEVPLYTTVLEQWYPVGPSNITVHRPVCRLHLDLTGFLQGSLVEDVVGGDGGVATRPTCSLQFPRSLTMLLLTFLSMLVNSPTLLSPAVRDGFDKLAAITGSLDTVNNTTSSFCYRNDLANFRYTLVGLLGSDSTITVSYTHLTLPTKA